MVRVLAKTQITQSVDCSDRNIKKIRPWFDSLLRPQITKSVDCSGGNIGVPWLNSCPRSQITQSVDCSGGNIAGPRLNSCLRPQITQALGRFLAKTSDNSVSRQLGWQYEGHWFDSWLRPQITPSVDSSGGNMKGTGSIPG
ncbi:hypothetical protein RRG08_052542 [Elysia crispata]|uniref:Uncharacterized protein n=1 Tax=Elysia crispata TaxID=231223 RepID=A0AAE0Z5J9_9GAST|nr:hypothetical protein RRG08_052542 [Elysia crispata]